MAFFSNNFDDARKNVVSALKRLGVQETEPDQADDVCATWRLTVGSADVFVSVIKADGNPDSVVFQVLAPVMGLPDKNLLPLYRKLLELNASALFGACFSLEGATVNVLGERLALNLDEDEFVRLIDRVAGYADKYDDELVSEFGGIRASDQTG